MKTKAATTTATSTAAPHRIIRVSMRHHRRLECASSVRSNRSLRFRERSLYSHSASETEFAGVATCAPMALCALCALRALCAFWARGGRGATGGDQSAMKVFEF